MARIESYAELKTKLDLFDMCVKSVCKPERACNVFVAAGDPGLGKTYRATKIVNEMVKTKQIPAMDILEGNVTALSLYQKMWKLREGGVIIIDDVASVIEDKKVGIPLLKIATDTYASRMVSWNSNDRRVVKVSKFDPKDNMEVLEHFNGICDSNQKLMALRESGDAVPDRFYFKGSIIIITNKSWDNFDRLSDGAIGNRGRHLDIRTTLECSIDYVKHMASSIKEQSSFKITKPVADAVVKYITTDKEVLTYYMANGVKPGLRIFGAMCDAYKDYGKAGLNLNMLEASLTKEKY
jgi:hypothetical protein